MGFLRRLFGGGSQAAPTRAQSAQPEVLIRYRQFEDQRPEAELEVVGESWRQEHIGYLSGLVTGGPHSALLMPEPDNPKDRNAIRVMMGLPDGSDFSQVGYLSREDALRYAPVVHHVAPRIIRAPARIKSGGDRGPGGAPMHGVVLNLGTPCELLAEIWLDGRELAGAHQWLGQMVCFTGASTHAIHGIRLDRETQMTLARKVGCEPWPRMTKKVRLCVVANASVDTEKVRQAEANGTVVVTEFEFWRTVGLPLDRY